MALTVEQLYQQYAGRAGDPGGIDYFSQLFGPTIEPDEAARFQTAIAEARAQGSEQAAPAPTNLTVNDLYQQYAGRAGDVGGVDYFNRLFGPEVDTNEAARFQTAIAEARLQGTEPTTPAQTAEARRIAAAAAADLARRQSAITAQTQREVNAAAASRAQDAINAAAGSASTPSAAPSLPFEFATQGFPTSFANYQSIPIGAQYNPSVVGGVGSPYSQIMSQMRPVGNPYAGVVSNLPMGGYNPNIYDPNLLSNFVAQRAGNAAALNADQIGGDGVGGTGRQGRSTLAPVEYMGGTVSGFGAADPSGMFGGAQSGDVGFAEGGMIDRVAGQKPAGPDDGQINAQLGEYVIKKSAVNKYGKGLLDMINTGKIPAKKIKSLLD